MSSRDPKPSPCGWCGTPTIEVTWDEQMDMPPFGTTRLEPHALDAPHILAAIVAGRDLWQLYNNALGIRTRKRGRAWPRRNKNPPGHTLTTHQCGYHYTGLPEITLDTVRPPTPENPPF